MLVEFHVTISGVAPMYQHNAELLNPRNKFKKAMARITSLPPKQKNTDENIEALQRFEWAGSLYFTGKSEIVGSEVTWEKAARVVIPSKCIWACITEGGKKQKLGTALQSALLVDNDAQFLYDGPLDINDLAKDDRFLSYERVAVGGKSVMRTRPVFRSWSAEVAVTVDTESIQPELLLQSIQDAGRFYGLGDWSPKNGRFVVDNFKAEA